MPNHNRIKKVYLLLIWIFLTLTIQAQVNSNHVWVNGYTKSNGTYVEGHYRTAPNSTNVDNFSTKGNTNPYTGQAGYITPDYNSNYSTTPSYISTPSLTSSPKYSSPKTNSSSSSDNKSIHLTESEKIILLEKLEYAYTTLYLTEEARYRLEMDYNMTDRFPITYSEAIKMLDNVNQLVQISKDYEFDLYNTETLEETEIEETNFKPVEIVNNESLDTTRLNIADDGYNYKDENLNIDTTTNKIPTFLWFLLGIIVFLYIFVKIILFNNTKKLQYFSLKKVVNINSE